MAAYWVEVSWKLAAVAFFVLLNGFFVAAEFALVRVRQTQLTGKGPGTAAARHVTKRMDAYLAACQLGITFASLGLGWIGEPAVSELLVEPLFGAFLEDEGTVRAVSIAVGFAVISALHIVVGELAPKSLAIRRPREVALGTAVPLRLFHRVFAPFIWSLNAAGNGLVRLLGIAPPREGDHEYSLEEIRLLLAQFPVKEKAARRSAEVAGRVFELQDLAVKDIMVPRAKMVLLDIRREPQENVATVKSHRFTRYPLADGGPDTILGFVHVRDMFAALEHGATPDFVSLRREVLVVPAAQLVSRTLFDMLEKKRRMGIVVDERGATAGLVTLEDVLEEIVGEIPGEFDQPESHLKVLGPGHYLVDASVPLHELQVVLREPIPRTTAATMAGLLNEQFGHIPEPGEEVRVGGYSYRVVEADKFRARSVEVRLVEPATAQARATEPA